MSLQWPIAEIAYKGWALSLCKHEDGLWEVARHLQPKTFPDFKDKSAFTYMSYKKRLNYILSTIVKAILDQQPFTLEKDGFKHQLFIAQQLTGIRPPPRTTTPLRKCLDRYFDASLEVNTLEAIQNAMFDLSMRWGNFIQYHNLSFIEFGKHTQVTKKALREWQKQFRESEKRWKDYRDDGKTKEDLELEEEEKKKDFKRLKDLQDQWWACNDERIMNVKKKVRDEAREEFLFKYSQHYLHY